MGNSPVDLERLKSRTELKAPFAHQTLSKWDRRQVLPSQSFRRILLLVIQLSR
jgi:hypothetical protein